MPTELVVRVNDSEINALSASITGRIVNQGHGGCVVVVENLDGGYTDVFDVNDGIGIWYNDMIVFSGTIDSVRHSKEQGSQWSLNDQIRLVGKDLSADLSSKLVTRIYPADMHFDDMIAEAISDTGCEVSIDPYTTVTISGHTSIDESLNSLVAQVLEEAQYEGYVTTSGTLAYFPIGTERTRLILSKSNVVGVEPIEAQGSYVYNSIDVYGELSTIFPEIDGDEWTEDSLDGWDLVAGDLLEINAASKVGDNSIFVENTVDNVVEVLFTLPETVGANYLGQYSSVSMYFKVQVSYNREIYFYCYTNDPADYYYTILEVQGFDILDPSTWFGGFGSWKYFTLPLGVENTKSERFPDGQWVAVGSPDWLNISKLGWWQTEPSTDPNIGIDGLYFAKKRYHYHVEDATSIAAYRKRQLVTVGNAMSDEECKSIAEDMLIRLKDPVSIVSATSPLEFAVSGWMPGHTVRVNSELL